MKLKLLCIGLLTINVLFGQDTLELTNGNEFGYNEQYILYPNGTFKYKSEGYCTGATNLGIGNYVRSKKKIEFNFESMDSLASTAVCVNSNYSDSVKILTYNIFDSTKVNGLVGYSSQIGRASTNNLYSRTDSTLDFISAGMNIATISLDSTCSEYHIYLVPKHTKIEVGLVDIIVLKSKKWCKTTTYLVENEKGKLKKNKYVSWYTFK